jgi:RES domain
VFSIRFRTSSGIDITRPPFDADRARWTHLTDYTPCQALADGAREAGVDVVRYASARAAAALNYALLSCRAFASREPVERQTWRLDLGPWGARGLCDFPAARLALDRQAFAADPRIAALVWDR